MAHSDGSKTVDMSAFHFQQTNQAPTGAASKVLITDSLATCGDPTVKALPEHRFNFTSALHALTCIGTNGPTDEY